MSTRANQPVVAVSSSSEGVRKGDVVGLLVASADVRKPSPTRRSPGARVARAQPAEFAWHASARMRSSTELEQRRSRTSEWAGATLIVAAQARA